MSVEIPANYELVGDVLDVYNAVTSECPLIFLAGRAGTGKSTFIQYLRNNIDKNVVVLAPTGVAALNALGTTIHSFFWFPPKFDKCQLKDRSNDPIIKNLDLIILDEISMVRSDVLDNMDYALRRWKKTPNLPFGGVQMLFVGDCFQLPPVLTNAESDVFGVKYKSPWFFDSNVIQNNKLFCYELKKVYRQHDDDFIGLLDDIRLNKNLDKALARFNTRILQDECDEHRLVLTATNYHADKINNSKFRQLKGQIYEYVAELSGAMPEDRLPVPEELSLKVGAHVMLRKNLDRSKYPESAVNGALGVVLECHDDSVAVELFSGPTITVFQETWTNYKYVFDSDKKEIKAETIGEYRQIPLVKGWAITIHKAQGLSLDKVDLDIGSGAFAAGQLYVALSRCRTFDGIVLHREIGVDDVMTDGKIIKFYKQNFGSGDGGVVSPEWCEHVLMVDGKWQFSGIDASGFSVCPLCGKPKP